MTYSMNMVELMAKREAAKALNGISQTKGHKAPDNEALPHNALSLSLKSVEAGVVLPNKFKARTIAPNFDPATIPVREWMITNYLRCGYINLLISPGAVGKSIFTIVELISVATGDDLLKIGGVKQGNVLVINNEDDDDELDRRITAVCQHYKIKITDLNERLFIRSGYGEKVLIAQEIENTVTATAEVNLLIEYIKEKDIRVLVIDPFVSTHNSNENDNLKIDHVAQVYKEIASKTNVAIRLVHHTKKLGNDIDAHAGDVETARGASSLKDAGRVCHTLSPIGKKFAEKHNIDFATKAHLIRLDGAKTNFTLNDYKPKIFYLQSVQIANGDWIGAPRPYDLEINQPSALETKEKAKAKTIHDIGRAVIEKLGSEGGKIRCSDILGDYMNLTGYKKSQASDNFTMLPIGSVKKELIKLNGTGYRIYQTKEDKATAPRYVHLEPDH